jgi:hypothetical protein
MGHRPACPRNGRALEQAHEVFYANNGAANDGMGGWSRAVQSTQAENKRATLSRRSIYHFEVRVFREARRTFAAYESHPPNVPPG